MPPPTKEERVHGSLLGLAVGDALGATVEFMPPGSFEEVTGMAGGGKFSLQPGQWTDDTSMALCLAESIVECQGFNPLDQASRYWRWYQDGHLSSTGECFDIGKTTRKALHAFDASGHTRHQCGPTSDSAAGNGSLMRLCPVALAYHLHPVCAMALCRESSLITHGAQSALDACMYFGGLLIGCLRGCPKEELLSPCYSPVDKYWDQNTLAPDVIEVAGGSFKGRCPPAIKASGHVVRSLEAALWAFHCTSNFREGCLRVVNLGDDSDTVGAIYGQLAGAYYGCQTSTLNENLKDTCYLKKGTEILRRLRPCPKQFKSLEAFDEAVESLKTSYRLLPTAAQDQDILSSFDRMCLSLMVNRTKLM